MPAEKHQALGGSAAFTLDVTWGGGEADGRVKDSCSQHRCFIPHWLNVLSHVANAKGKGERSSPRRPGRMVYNI